MDFSGIYYPINAKYSYGPSDNNRAHVFMLASLWELRFGTGCKFDSNMSRPVDMLLGGWQVNRVCNAELSGLQFRP